MRHCSKRASTFRRAKTAVNDVSNSSVRFNLHNVSQQLLNEKLSHDERNSLEEKVTSLGKIAKDMFTAASISEAAKLLKFWSSKMICHHLMKLEVTLKDC